LSAVFGNPQLDIEHAYHVLGGANFKLTDHLSVEEVVFYSKSADLVTRSNSSTPLLAAALVQEGQAAPTARNCCSAKSWRPASSVGSVTL